MATEMQCNQSIFTFPHIVKKVFQFLPAKSLCNVASVCKEWQTQAERILAQRQQYSWELFEEDEESVPDKMKRYFEEIPFRPRFVLVFLTQHLFQQLQKFDNRKRKRGNNLTKKSSSVSVAKFDVFCTTMMPSQCQVFCSVTPGIVGTSSDMKCITEKESGPNASIVCFGQYPNMKVNLRTMMADLQDEEHVKLMLLMSDLRAGVTALRNVRRKLPSTLIVGGDNSKSYVHSVLPSERSMENLPYFVVFQGEAVQVASVKLDIKVDSGSKVEPFIMKLKEKTQHFNMKNSLAFMYACAARGTEIYDTENVESSLFHKHFPNTPLVGFFGNGEVGSEYPYLTGLAPDEEVHGYTTFLAVLSLP